MFEYVLYSLNLYTNIYQRSYLQYILQKYIMNHVILSIAFVRMPFKTFVRSVVWVQQYLAPTFHKHLLFPCRRKGKNTIALEIIYIMILKICNKIHAYARKRIPHWPPQKRTPQKKLAQKANLHPIAPWVKNVAPPSARLLWLLPASSLKVTRASWKVLKRKV